MDTLNQPLYQQIYNYLIDEIKSGKYRDGSRIPSEKELAEKFGVSRITSKKALELMAEKGLIQRMQGKGSFVVEAADNIEPLLSGDLVAESRKESLIGVVMSDFSESYGIGLLKGIEKETSESGSFIAIQRSLGRQDIEEKVIDELISLGVDGIIIMPVHGEHYNPKILRLILDGFPIVFIDRCLKGIPAPFVGSDNITAAKKATDYLLSLGHRNISFLSPPYVDTSTIEDRIEGFVKSHAEHGVVIDESIWVNDLTSTMPGTSGSENIQADIGKIKDLLARHKNITCLFASEYNIALIAREAVKALGKKVPNDISIVCFDSPDSFLGDYYFTHIRQRESEMGATAVKLLQKLMKEKDINDKIYLDADLTLGLTTRARNNNDNV